MTPIIDCLWVGAGPNRQCVKQLRLWCTLEMAALVKTHGTMLGQGGDPFERPPKLYCA